MEKLLVIVTLLQRAYGKWLFHRLLSGLLITAGLLFVISLLIGALLIGGLYGAHMAFLQHGMEPQSALLATGGATVLVIAILLTVARYYIVQFRHLPRTLFSQSPITSGPMNVVDSFLAGLSEGSNAPRR